MYNNCFFTQAWRSLTSPESLEEDAQKDKELEQLMKLEKMIKEDSVLKLSRYDMTQNDLASFDFRQHKWWQAILDAVTSFPNKQMKAFLQAPLLPDQESYKKMHAGQEEEVRQSRKEIHRSKKTDRDFPKKDKIRS